MPKFLRDAFELMRFRPQPLAAYVYPAWQPLAWLVFLGVVTGLLDKEFQTGVAQKIAFSVILNLLESMLFSIWMMGWFRLVLKRPLQNSVFPLVVLTSVARLLLPLADLAPAKYGFVFSAMLAFYGVYVLVIGLAGATGEKRGTIFLAVLAYMPITLLLFVVAITQAAGWGWIVIPASTGGGAL